ncbi:hypothetical protein [Variovorax sp. OV329]|uniref:hypothetical protein n=1 Tax=Variovorax sp. OV329 TaxID=1882825 RepID=UPI000B8150F8|nr:hypothetical protein [Variovorax sp. OV329]
MTSVLIVVTWLQLGGPQVSMQPFETPARCEVARDAAGQMLIEQARSNLVGLHQAKPVTKASPDGARALTLRTSTAGRELARLQCL